MRNLPSVLLTICFLILIIEPITAQKLNKQETLDYLSNMLNQEWLKYATAIDEFEYKTQYQTLVKIKNKKNGNVYADRYSIKDASFRYEKKRLDDGTFLLMGTRIRYEIIISNSDGDATLTSFASKSDAEKFVRALKHLETLTRENNDPFDSE